MPERLRFVKAPSPSPCPWNQTLDEKVKKMKWRDGTPAPFTSVKDPRYLLRTEAVDSMFVLWRVAEEEFRRGRGVFFSCDAEGGWWEEGD
ncbi:glycoside hydrolase family 47 protein [Candidatus Bathyarchaeota archaeon]|nr:glycoside hydrolase family 47 protein [Candidatus Bathyarchaeota archaeon]